MAYKHQVSISESGTSVLSPVEAAAGLPVYFGTAPIHLTDNPSAYVNKPVLAYSYEEAVKALGYHSDWNDYTLCEAIKAQFQLFNVAPAVFVNVLDPSIHKENVADSAITLSSGKYTIAVDGVLLSTLVVKLTGAGNALVRNKDYTVVFNGSGHPVISRVDGGDIPANQTSLTVSYDKLTPSTVTDAQIIGGIDSGTGKVTGLELINKIFPLYRLVPGQIVVPKHSKKPAVAAVMKAKSTGINSLFKAMAIADIDSSSTGAGVYTEAPAWKNNNNFSDPHLVACYLKAKLGDEIYHLSTQFAALNSKVMAENGNVPYVSPSNKNIQANAVVNEADTEINLGVDQAAYLNGEGIVTAINFVGGWKMWGNNTSVYPAHTDVKDRFIPVRQMFNWIGNTLILTHWQVVDDPTNRRLIDTVVDSTNIWLNGLTAQGSILGGRVEFRAADNPVTSLLDGKVSYRLFLAAPVPAENIEFKLEFDVAYLQNLFAA
ncbi:phage tail sheath family protein [Brevibacillus brevis]|uniref:phage tail sheath family protein n=1 Tax=Brevibacillus brevis TaxID=1393 RepID=UPI003D1FCA7E